MDDTYSMNEIYVKDVVGSSSGFQAEEDSNVDGLTGASSDSNISGRQEEQDDIEGDDCDVDGGNFDHHEEHDDTKKSWIPNVSVELTPKIGDYFPAHQLAESFYRKYAEQAGFDVRLSIKKINNKGVITNRYYVCSKQGIPTPRTFDSLEFGPGKRKRRNTNLKRTGCKACFKVRFVKDRNRYEVYKFVEHHNHILLNEDEMRFSRSNRQLSYAEQKNVFHSCSQKVGVTKGHRFRNALNCGVRKSGGTVRDYQNYRRDMNTFVGNKDAQMLINTMASRQEICPDYFYEYKVDDKELQGIFWADETARLNYKEFGDVISFDATFRTNKHAMSFVPFVAVDNHKKSVVVGAGLISGETVDHYKWILKAFLKAHGRQPKFVITDQCAAIKQTIPDVLPESKHRLCMWHIMEKVDGKISVFLKHKTSFKTDLNKLVWNVNLDPSVFEVKWNELMHRYNLVGDSWFEEMFAIRGSWIPAYFKDFPMSGLMKTTSRSESINAFFNVFHAYHRDLMLFLHSFDNAIETQRKKHAADEVKDKSTVPRMVTPSRLEEHASLVYSRTIFFEFQNELSKAMFSCVWDGSCEVGGNRVFTISQENKAGEVKNKFTVVRDRVLGTIECGCNFFVRNGILCRHSLKVLMNEKADNIPDRYLVRRWLRDLVPVEWLPARVRYGETDAEVEKLMGDAHSFFEVIVEKLRADKDSLAGFVSQLRKWNSDINIDSPELTSRQRKKANIQEFMGSAPVDTVDILPPSGLRNKGCGTGKRLVGHREKAISKSKKPKRVCRKCGELARHDSRNCPER